MPHPATFMTVTLMLPGIGVLLALLMKTCRKPMTVTGVVEVVKVVTAALSYMGKDTMDGLLVI